MKKSRIFLLIFLISVQVAFSQNSIKDRILSGIMPQANSVTVTNFAPRGNISSTIFGNAVTINNNKYYISNSKEKEKKQIISELSSSPKEKQSGDIMKKTEIEDVYNNIDTNTKSYDKTCVYFDFEIKANLEKDLSLAIEKALMFEKIAKVNKDSFQLAKVYSMLFFMYASKDIKELALPYGERVDSLLNDKFNDKGKLLEIYNWISRGHYFLGNYKKALEIELKTQSIVKECKSAVSVDVMKNYFRIGKSYGKLNNKDSQFFYYEKCIKIIGLHNNVDSLNFTRELFVDWSLMYSDKTKDFITSIKYMKKAIGIAIKEKDSISLANHNCDLGYLFYKIDKIDSSLLYYRFSAQIYDRINTDYKSKRITYYNLGCTYFDLNEYDSSYLYSNKALKGYEGDTTSQSQVFINWSKYFIGISSRFIKSNNEPLQYMIDAHNFFHKNYGIYSYVTRRTKSEIGQIYVRLEIFDSAQACFDSVIVWEKKVDLKKQNLYFSFWDKALLYSRKNDFTQALQMIDSAIFYYNFSNKNNENFITLLNLKSDFYNRNNNNIKAIEMQNEIYEKLFLDSALYKKHYFNTIKNLSFLYSFNHQNEKSIDMLFACKDYIDLNKDDTSLYKNYYSLSILAKNINNPFLCSYFMEKENQNLRKNKRIEKEILISFLFENEKDVIESYLANNDREKALLLYNNFKNIYKKIYKNDLQKNIEIEFINVRLNYSDSIEFQNVIFTLGEIQNNIKKNKFQYTNSSYIYIMSKTYEYYTKTYLQNKKFSYVGTYLQKLEELYFLTNDSILRDDVGGKIRNLTILYERFKNDSISQNWLKKGLKYKSRYENIEVTASTFFNISIFDCIYFDRYEYIDSVKKYENHLQLSDFEKRYLKYLYVKYFVSINNYKDALKIYDSIQILHSDWFSIDMTLLEVLCHNIFGNINKMDLLYMKFKNDYRETINEDKNNVSFFIENILKISIKTKTFKMFEFMIKDLEKCRGIGLANLYRVYNMLELGDEKNALSLLEKTTSEFVYECGFFSNNPFLNKIKYSQEYKKIISNCK